MWQSCQSRKLAANDVLRNPEVNLSGITSQLNLRLDAWLRSVWMNEPNSSFILMEYYCQSVPSVGIYMQNRRKFFHQGKKWKNFTQSSLKLPQHILSSTVFKTLIKSWSKEKDWGSRRDCPHFYTVALRKFWNVEEKEGKRLCELSIWYL